MDTIPAQRERLNAELVDAWNAVAPNYNAWPNSLQLVSVDEIDSRTTAFSLGRQHGYAGIERSILSSNVLVKGLDHIFTDHLERVHVTRPWSLGTHDRKPTPNFWVIVVKNGQIHRIELGCVHNMTGAKLGNCWHLSECSKCGFAYEIDSSG